MGATSRGGRRQGLVGGGGPARHSRSSRHSPAQQPPAQQLLDGVQQLCAQQDELGGQQIGSAPAQGVDTLPRGHSGLCVCWGGVCEGDPGRGGVKGGSCLGAAPAVTNAASNPPPVNPNRRNASRLVSPEVIRARRSNCDSTITLSPARRNRSSTNATRIPLLDRDEGEVLSPGPHDAPFFRLLRGGAPRRAYS